MKTKGGGKWKAVAEKYIYYLNGHSMQHGGRKRDAEFRE